jgi:hypothetical protein
MKSITEAQKFAAHARHMVSKNGYFAKCHLETFVAQPIVMTKESI